MGLEKATVTVMIAPWWHLILLPQMRQRKGRAEVDAIHADNKSISPLTPDLRQSWNEDGEKKKNTVWNKHKHKLCDNHKVNIEAFSIMSSNEATKVKQVFSCLHFRGYFQCLTFWRHSIACVCGTIYYSLQLKSWAFAYSKINVLHESIDW